MIGNPERRVLTRARALIVAASGGTMLMGMGADGPVTIGERPAVEMHLDQSMIDSGLLDVDELFHFGEILFDARFNSLDGQGRPATTGGGAPRDPDEPEFIRTSAPDSNACAGCHSQPRSGGAGDFVVNVFVLAQTLDPVTFSVHPDFSNERNTLGMNGSGPIEMLAREMTDELLATRDRCASEAARLGIPVTKTLLAKGVFFGQITIMPDGMIDPSEIEGVDWDLIIKPFHQKGAVVSLREFTNNAMNHHHGMQSVERFGTDTDPDMDGMPNELTVGDITATTIYQAALDTPTRVFPDEPQRRRAIRRGNRFFRAIGCAECHVTNYYLDNRYFTEPNPYNPAGNLQVDDVPEPFRFNMTTEGVGTRLRKAPGGRAVLRPFTDLKRHDLTDEDLTHFGNERVPQGMINGFAPASEFTIAPFPRPTQQFLTRKLWDVGNTGPYGHRGDLTTITEAVYYHGGEARASREAFFAMPQADQAAIVEFLKSMQVADEVD
ncbi:MAG: hypothetical protein H6811_07305 [Phycisphaeraceae bacterium]|nr:hypothetical protein [Phycisphaeraceae bacterium]